MSDSSVPSSPLAEATGLMLEAMRSLKEKKITPQEATSFALLGHSVIEAAREVTAFAKATGYLPAGSVYGDRLQALEPQVTREAVEAQTVRLSDGARAICAPGPASKSRASWKNDGEFV